MRCPIMQTKVGHAENCKLRQFWRHFDGTGCFWGSGRFGVGFGTEYSVLKLLKFDIGKTYQIRHKI
jgi:hypothetical protein